MRLTLVESSCPELASCLIGYIGGEIEDSGQMVRRVVPVRPNCFVQIILKGGYRLHELASGQIVEPPRIGLFGPQSGYLYDFEVGGGLKSFTAQLQPAAASRLFQIDPVSLVNSFVPVTLPDGLLEQMQSATDWDGVAAPVDQWLKALTGGRAHSDPVAREASRLRKMDGMIPIQELADAAGLSLRHFQRRFRQLTGLNPKHYARICRVSHAIHRKELEPDAPWTELALEAGYADQSHFIRDFKAMTGTLPSEFLRGQRLILA